MLHLGQIQQYLAQLFTIYKKNNMQYGKIENGEVIYYQKPENILCEDPTLRGYKEVVTIVGESSGITETETQIILNIQQPEPILPTLEERQSELKEKFAVKQMQIKQALITAEETVGSENTTLLYLKTQLLNERVRIITVIDNFATIEEAMAFDIRDEDAKPFMDALYNLINSI